MRELKLTVRESHTELAAIFLGDESCPNSTEEKPNETTSPKGELPDSRNDPVIRVFVLDISILPIILSELVDRNDNLIRLASSPPPNERGDKLRKQDHHNPT
jgi:hypothetical protein